MFLKSLQIINKKTVIRDISFKYGLNIIVDDTHSETDLTETGNNVGKTTALKLIYFCFGGKPNSIYTDEDSKGNCLEEVKTFLESNNILVRLTLADSLDEDVKQTITIERSFGTPRIYRVNGTKLTSEDAFTESVKKELFRMDGFLRDREPSISLRFYLASFDDLWYFTVNTIPASVTEGEKGNHNGYSAMHKRKRECFHAAFRM